MHLHPPTPPFAVLCRYYLNFYGSKLAFIMAPRRFFNDSDKYPQHIWAIIVGAVAVLLTSVCGFDMEPHGHVPKVPPVTPPEITRSFGVRLLKLSPDGKKVLALDAPHNQLQLLDTFGNTAPVNVAHCSTDMPFASFSPGGKYLLHHCNPYSSAVITNLLTGTEIFLTGCEPEFSRALAWSADDRWLAAYCPRTGIGIWDMETGKRSRLVPVRENTAPQAIYLTPSELVAVTITRQILFWDLSGPGARSQNLSGNISHTRLLPDQKQLVIVKGRYASQSRDQLTL
jgi:WD40 repeat protein